MDRSYKPCFLCLAGAKRLYPVEQLVSGRLSQHIAQSTAAKHDAEAQAGHQEARISSGYAITAAKHQISRCAVASPVNHRHSSHWQMPDALQQLLDTHQPQQDIAIAGIIQTGKIQTTGKTSSGCFEHHLTGLLIPGSIKTSVQTLHQCIAERVHLLGAVQRQCCSVVFKFKENSISHGHSIRQPFCCDFVAVRTQLRWLAVNFERIVLHNDRKGRCAGIDPVR